MDVDRCFVCGEIIPEGIQVCPTCENQSKRTDFNEPARPCTASHACDYEVGLVARNVTVVAMRCKKCGHWQVEWLRQENTEVMTNESEA